MTKKLSKNVEEMELKHSEKNANFGKVGGFNKLKKVVKRKTRQHKVVLEFYSQKLSAPGQIIRFSKGDFERFQEFIAKKNGSSVEGEMPLAGDSQEEEAIPEKVEL